RRPENRLGDPRSRNTRALGKSIGRGQSDEPRPRQRSCIPRAERAVELRHRRRRMRRAVEGVRIEEARQRTRLQAIGFLEQRPEEILPAQHPVAQQVEPRVLLDGDELRQVALDLVVDGLLGGAPPVEVPGRLDELLRTRVDARRESLHQDLPAVASWFSAALILCSSCHRSASDSPRSTRSSSALACSSCSSATVASISRTLTAVSTSASARSFSTVKNPGPVATSSPSPPARLR